MEYLASLMAWTSPSSMVAIKDKEEQESGFDSSTLFHDIPPEITEKIWLNLNYTDQNSVRQSCRRFKAEIETNVGVHGRLDGTMDNFDWVGSVKLRSLTIENLLSVRIPLDEYWWKPNFLQKLVIVQGSLSFSNGLSVLKTFSGLKELTFAPMGQDDFQTFGILAPRHNLFTSNELPAILNAVQLNRKLELLAVNLYSVTRDTRKYRNNHRVNWEAVQWNRYFADLKHLTMLAPDMHGTGRQVFIRFLETQPHLETLCCDMGLVNPNDYRPIIERLTTTLKVLELYNVSCSQGNTSSFFNWKCLNDCVNLEVLKICAERNGDDNAFYLFCTDMNHFRFERLLEFELDHVKLTSSIFSKLLMCACRKMKVLKLHFFMLPLTTQLYDELDWALHYGRFNTLSLAEQTQRFENEDNYFTEIVATAVKGTNYWMECSSPHNGFTLLEFNRPEELQV